MTNVQNLIRFKTLKFTSKEESSLKNTTIKYYNMTRGVMTNIFMMIVFHCHSFLRNELNFSVFMAHSPSPFRGQRGHVTKFFKMAVSKYKTLQFSII